MTDAELVEQTLAGHLRSFDELVDRHFDDCLRFARHMLGTGPDAEDAVQETFLRAYRGLGRYRELQTFRAWLFRILINRCRSAASQRRRRDARVVLDEAAVEGAVNETPATGLEEAIVLSAALAKLDPLPREAFVLHFGEGLNYAEMARLTGAGISALKMRVKRARERMREHLEENEDVG